MISGLSLKEGGESMPFYYFNRHYDEHFRHEVHTEDCSCLPNAKNRILIGLELSCKDAIHRAELENPDKEFDGCFWCCNLCNSDHN